MTQTQSASNKAQPTQPGVVEANNSAPAPINNLPILGSVYPVGSLLLKCIAVSTKDYAAIYEVMGSPQSKGRIYMDWQLIWTNSLKEQTFTSPYEAICNLLSSTLTE